MLYNGIVVDGWTRSWIGWAELNSILAANGIGEESCRYYKLWRQVYDNMYSMLRWWCFRKP